MQPLNAHDIWTTFRIYARIGSQGSWHEGCSRPLRQNHDEPAVGSPVCRGSTIFQLASGGCCAPKPVYPFTNGVKPFIFGNPVLAAACACLGLDIDTKYENLLQQTVESMAKEMADDWSNGSLHQVRRTPSPCHQPGWFPCRYSPIYNQRSSLGLSSLPSRHVSCLILCLVRLVRFQDG